MFITYQFTYSLYIEKWDYKGDFPCAEQYYEEAISIPLYPDLRVSEQNKVIDLINNYFK